jgi:RHS repeat-associated protein
MNRETASYAHYERRHLRLRPRPRQRPWREQRGRLRSPSFQARRLRASRVDRDYDPTTGTFLTPDPLTQGPGSPELGTGVGFGDGEPTVANPYHYVDNDPLNKVDPLGLWPWDDLCVRNPVGGDGQDCERHPVQQGVADFSGGLFDGVFAGQGREIFLNPAGLDSRVNWNSNWVTAGQWTGYGIDAVILAQLGVGVLATSDTWMFSSGFLSGGTILAGAPSFLAVGFVGYYVFAQLFGEEKREGQRLGDAGLRYLNPSVNPDWNPEAPLPFQYWFPESQRPFPSPVGGPPSRPPVPPRVPPPPFRPR